MSARLEELLRRAFPEATELSVEDRTGGGDHFQVTVASARFTGLSLVDQHRLVYDALADPLADGTIHELRIRTRGSDERAARAHQGDDRVGGRRPLHEGNA